jgi:hypothetical protein
VNGRALPGQPPADGKSVPYTIDRRQGPVVNAAISASAIASSQCP